MNRRIGNEVGISLTDAFGERTTDIKERLGVGDFKVDLEKLCSEVMAQDLKTTSLNTWTQLVTDAYRRLVDWDSEVCQG